MDFYFLGLIKIKLGDCKKLLDFFYFFRKRLNFRLFVVLLADQVGQVMEIFWWDLMRFQSREFHKSTRFAIFGKVDLV